MIDVGFSSNIFNVDYDYCSKDQLEASNCCNNNFVEVLLDNVIVTYCCQSCDIPTPPPDSPIE